MANNLPPLWRFDFSDYAQLGNIFQKFLANLNLFTLAVYNILNKGIGFPNLQREIFKATITAGTTNTLSFVNPLPVFPSGVSVVQVQVVAKTETAITGIVSAANWDFDGRNINILNITGLTAGQTYNISFEVC